MLLYNINYYYNIYIRAQVYNNVGNHDDCKTPKKTKRQKTKRHFFFVYIAQRTLLKIFQRVRDEARKIF